ncbi:mechanosensitive ion channel protein [Cupriavidus sp. IDO]|nr:mechanosensitive ion channel protein [Cupriavidus sp. IDO]
MLDCRRGQTIQRVSAMSKLSRLAPGLVLVALIHLMPSALPAAFAADAASDAEAQQVPALTHTEAVAELKRLQTEQDRIKQLASSASGNTRLEGVDDNLKQLAKDVDKLEAALKPQRAQLQAQLDVLGPPPAAGKTAEAPAVAQQRADLNARRTQLDNELKQAAEGKENIANLNDQLAKLQRGWMKDQLALRSESILNPQFWAPLFKPSPEDKERMDTFKDEVVPMLQSAWQPGQRSATALLLLFALAVWTLGRRLAERGLAWFCLTRLPETRLRRSALALATALTTVVTTALAVQVTFIAFTRLYEVPPDLQDLLGELFKLTLTSALIAGLGRALLCTRHPSWRLPALADPVARAMKPFPRLLAGLLLLAGTLEVLNRMADTSVQVTLLGRGLVSLVVVLTIGAALMRANRVRTELAAAGERPEARATLAGMIHAGVTVTIIVSLGALLLGYISFARFLTYELVWFDIVLCTLYLLTQLTRDTSESLFSTEHTSGRLIKQLFGIDDEHLEQVSTVLSGIGASLLLLLAVIALLTGGFGTTPVDLLNSLLLVLGGEKLRSLNIMPDRIMNAVIALTVGIWLLRSVRRWLDAELLPKVCKEPGLRASLVTLYSNVGYVLLVLLTLSLLGVKWENLAWIVSALSVGIGFGLQEIVKNFVSGLILLTERPVKVGDMVSIGTVEGDIRRINVRATEIQLGDRSTVIVPNSQLISQNLRNVTMSNSTQGVATLQLTFPLNIDPEEVRDLLLGAYRDNESILDLPAPSVTFSQLAPNGITLSVTGYVASPRIAATTKSELLFEILKRLRAAHISLSVPQTLRVENMPGLNTELLTSAAG